MPESRVRLIFQPLTFIWRTLMSLCNIITAIVLTFLTGARTHNRHWLSLSQYACLNQYQLSNKLPRFTPVSSSRLKPIKFHFADNVEVKDPVYQAERAHSHSPGTPARQHFYGHLIRGAELIFFFPPKQNKGWGAKIESGFWDGCTIWGPCLAFSRQWSLKTRCEINCGLSYRAM